MQVQLLLAKVKVCGQYMFLGASRAEKPTPDSITLPEPHQDPDHQPAATDQEGKKHKEPTSSGHSSRSNNSQGNTSGNNQEYNDDHDYFQQGDVKNYHCFLQGLRFMASALIGYLYQLSAMR
ncbi:uncharacterized protein [Drosophila kikkawai]|uniref:Uncharacterized protein n=1 Tax=Drosophila kikkawai TaxID=30033 RepID=A0ABM4GR37_DROKI